MVSHSAPLPSSVVGVAPHAATQPPAAPALSPPAASRTVNHAANLPGPVRAAAGRAELSAASALPPPPPASNPSPLQPFAQRLSSYLPALYVFPPVAPISPVQAYESGLSQRSLTWIETESADLLRRVERAKRRREEAADELNECYMKLGMLVRESTQRPSAPPPSQGPAQRRRTSPGADSSIVLSPSSEGQRPVAAAIPPREEIPVSASVPRPPAVPASAPAPVLASAPVSVQASAPQITPEYREKCELLAEIFPATSTVYYQGQPKEIVGFNKATCKFKIKDHEGEVGLSDLIFVPEKDKVYLVKDNYTDGEFRRHFFAKILTVQVGATKPGYTTNSVTLIVEWVGFGTKSKPLNFKQLDGVLPLDQNSPLLRVLESRDATSGGITLPGYYLKRAAPSERAR